MASHADVLNAELVSIVNDVETTGVPVWHELTVDSVRRLEDELFTTGAA